MILRCLNPWGLLSNRRVDSENRDLNRCYHLNELPRITAHKNLMQGHFFRLAMCLHEGYDAKGVYLYEACKRLPRWLPPQTISRLINAGCSERVASTCYG